MWHSGITDLLTPHPLHFRIFFNLIKEFSYRKPWQYVPHVFKQRLTNFLFNLLLFVLHFLYKLFTVMYGARPRFSLAMDFDKLFFLLIPFHSWISFCSHKSEMVTVLTRFKAQVDNFLSSHKSRHCKSMVAPRTSVFVFWRWGKGLRGEGLISVFSFHFSSLAIDLLEFSYR